MFPVHTDDTVNERRSGALRHANRPPCRLQDVINPYLCQTIEDSKLMGVARMAAEEIEFVLRSNEAGEFQVHSDPEQAAPVLQLKVG